MNEQAMMHGVDWSGENLAGWYLTEKMDGCRGYWDGARFWSRSGRVIEAPEHIVAAMPKEHVDGEFWAGRGQFAKASAAVRFGGSHWAGVEFVPFDHPQRAGDWMARNRRGIVCKSTAHARRVVAEILGAGGEGVVAQRPGVGYQPGRSNCVLKLKQ